MTSEKLIMVIDQCHERGRSLKEQIEFMDTPRVEVATPASWREHLGNGRLAAVFISEDVGEQARDRLISDIGDLDPNTPIVMVAGAPEEAVPNA